MPNRIKTDTMRGVNTCNIRMGSLVASIRAVGVTERGHVCKISRYNCSCEGDLFGRPRVGAIFIACIGFYLNGQRRCALSCNAVQRRLRGCPILGLRVLHHIVVSVHRDGLPSPGILNGTNDFFVGPVIPHQRFRSLRQRCPSVPRCSISTNQMGVPTT